jgi:hypothetical protein
MQSVYTIYFNNGEEVTPLRYCNGYSHAEELINNVATEFMKVYYTERPHKICKYEGSNAEIFKAQLYKDTTFPEGIVFVQKKFEATVYEKTFTPGYLGGTIMTKYLGRIGVMAQQYEIPLYIKQQIENQQQQLMAQSTIITQQESTIRRQELDIKRSDYQIARCDIDLEQLRDMLKRHIEEKKSTANELNILNIRLAKLETDYINATNKFESLEAENTHLHEQLLLADVPIASNIPLAPPAPYLPKYISEPLKGPKRPLTELGRKNAAIAPVLAELKDAVVSGSWRRSEHSDTAKKLKDNQDLEHMITEIDNMTIQSQQKMKTE